MGLHSGLCGIQTWLAICKDTESSTTHVMAGLRLEDCYTKYYQDPPGVLTLFEWVLFPLWFFKISCFIVIIKLKLGVSGVFSVFLQHYMYQTWMCVLQIHSLLLRWKKGKLSYCKFQVSILRRFAFATLRWPHCVRPPTPLRQPGSATQYLLHSQPIPVLRLHDHSNHLLLHF